MQSVGQKNTQNTLRAWMIFGGLMPYLLSNSKSVLVKEDRLDSVSHGCGISLLITLPIDINPKMNVKAWVDLDFPSKLKSSYEATRCLFVAWNSLTLFTDRPQPSIALSRLSKRHAVSAQSWCKYILVRRQKLLCSYDRIGYCSF